MAAETTTTSLNDLTHASLIEPVIILALSEQPGIANRVCREFNLIGKPAIAASIPTETSWWGTAGESAEAGVDTEFDATQGTALGNTEFTTGTLTITPAEYGVAAALTDNVGEDSVLDFFNHSMSRMLHVLMLAMDADFLGLLGSLSNSVGSTNTDLSLANMLAAQQGVRSRGAIADSTAYILGNYQHANLETVLTSTNAAAAVYALAADRLIGYAPTSDYGMGPLRNTSVFRNALVYVSGLVGTANATVDSVGAYFCPTSAFNDANGSTTFGCAWKRLPRFETQRQAKLRATDLVMSARWGCAEIQDGSGTAIITNAAA